MKFCCWRRKWNTRTVIAVVFILLGSSNSSGSNSSLRNSRNTGDRPAMLKSCLSFCYKTTTTSTITRRTPGPPSHLLRTALEASRSPNQNAYRTRNNNNNNRRRYYNANNESPTGVVATMPKRKKQKFYAVAVGRNPGIYSTWEDCQSQVTGHSNARFKSFGTREEAESFVAVHGGRNAGAAASANGGVDANTDAFAGMAASITKRPRISAAAKATPKQKTSSKSESSSSSSNDNSTSSSTTGKARKTKPEKNTEASPDAAAPPSPLGHPHKLWFHVMFDGGSRGNPHGRAGSGTHVLTRKFYDVTTDASKKAKTEIVRDKTNIRTYLGSGLLTNNQAEYQGLVTGLETILNTVSEATKSKSKTKQNLNDVEILVQGDSDLIIKQMKGLYACKSPKLKPYHKKAKDLVRGIQTACSSSCKCHMIFEHVYREHNTIADGLANEAMDAQRSWTTFTGGGDNNNNSGGGGAIEV